jgi:hypothetical protein
VARQLFSPTRKKGAVMVTENFEAISPELDGHLKPLYLLPASHLIVGSADKIQRNPQVIVMGGSAALFGSIRCLTYAL